jgi:hypothetical protein
MTTISRNSATEGGEGSTGGERPTVARRQRRFALPAGVVLAVCIFLPALRVCGTPTYPIQMPMFWSPYLLGFAVALLAGARTLRALRPALIMIEIVMGLTVLGYGTASLFGGGEGVGIAFVIAAVGAGFFKLVRWGGPEDRAAHATIAIGVICTPWFALIAADPEAMFGAWISLAASIGVIAAGLEWRRELRAARREAFPRAIAHAA